MSRDLWLKQLRIAGTHTRSVEDVLTDNVPVDGLQHAGSALLRAERSDVLVTITCSLIEALGDRSWTGDAELIDELRHYADHTAADQIPLSVELDQLGEALDQSAGSGSFIAVTDGVLWPAQLFDVDQGPPRLRLRIRPVAARDRTRIKACVRGDAALHRNGRATGTRVASHRRACWVWCIPTVPVRTQPARGSVHALAPLP